MTVLPAVLRDEIRHAIDARRRAELDRSGGYKAVEAAERNLASGPARRPRQGGRRGSHPTPAPEARGSRGDAPSSAHRAQPTLVLRRCVYCGSPSLLPVCRAHEDLL